MCDRVREASDPPFRQPGGLDTCYGRLVAALHPPPNPDPPEPEEDP
jgi:hypothetical protein